ncbi:MAG: hypothetical protein LBJ59_03280 [Zoogloeaceae bacterium]|jgi:hypothetical protein|nr:hypothetical protein [Zoogloeaceae bacterium]
MTDVTTNPLVSGLHARIMQKELAAATNEAGLKAVAGKHTRFLLSKDLSALREAYATALKRVRKGMPHV